MGCKAKEANGHFFDTWNEESSYILGFIYADGHLQEQENNTSIWFHNNDRDLLEKIKLAMESESNIYDDDGCYKFCITNKQMTDRLKELGVTSKKSKTKEFPVIPMEMVPHFIRGYFDGNGHFTYESKGNEKKRMISGFTCGSESLINGLSEILEQLGLKRANVGYVDRRSSGRGTYYQIRYYKRDTILLYHLMYDNATIYMDRKKRYIDGYV
jgi:intein-encoded DNA endonuclease-like protein